MTLKSGKASDEPATIADLIWETDPEMCAFVFGDRLRWKRCCEVEWRADFGLHSHKAATVAQVDDRTVALLIAFPQAEMASRYNATVSRYEQATGKRMEAVGPLFPALPETALYIFNLAVDESVRGQGIGRQLLSKVEEIAQQSCLTSLHLDVAAHTPAVQFYERTGYRKLTETCLVEPVTNIPSHFRMYKNM